MTLLHVVALVQIASLAALVAVFLRPQAGWSRRTRLPVAIVVLVSSAAHLILSIA